MPTKKNATTTKNATGKQKVRPSNKRATTNPARSRSATPLITAKAVHDLCLPLDQAAQDIEESERAISLHCSNTEEKTNDVVMATEAISSYMTQLATRGHETEDCLHSVATSTEEMSATVAEIAQNAERARQVVETAVQSVGLASSRVGSLGTASKEISKVTTAIEEIADQTKLLALNATIEAARAGEAGKGFAVVASEVKELAQQTNIATSDIRTKIEAIQEATVATIHEIENITRVMDEVNNFVSIIAASTEEQSVTTRSISSSIIEVSSLMGEMTRNMLQAPELTSDVAETLCAANAGLAMINAAAQRIVQSNQRIKETKKRFVALAARCAGQT